MKFADEFRRVKACGRCSRLKTKCQFDSPESEKCVRCVKGGFECVPACKDDRPKRTSSSSSSVPSFAAAPKPTKRIKSFAYIERTKLESRDIETSEDRHEKIDQLQSVIREAEEEIKQLGGPTSSLPLDRNLEALQRADGFGVLIEYGIASLEQAEEYFEFFQSQMLGFFSLPISSDMSFATCRKKLPCTALAMVTAAIISSTKSHGEELLGYLERFLLEKTLVKTSQATIEDLARAFMVYIGYMIPIHDRNFSYFALLLCLGQSADLGGASDVRALTPGSSASAAEKRRALERSQLKVTLCTIGTAMAVNTARTYLLSLSTIDSGCLDALYSCGSAEDRMTIYMYRIVMCSKDYSDKIRDCIKTKAPPNTVVDVLRDFRTTMNDHMSAAELLAQQEQAKLSTPKQAPPREYYRIQRSLTSAQSTFDMRYAAVHQHALTFFLFGCENRPGRETIVNIAYEIMGYSKRSTDRFVRLCDDRAMIPKYYFFMLLHSLMNMARIRILLYSYGKEWASSSMCNVEYEMTRASDAWKRLGQVSLTASVLLPLIERLKEFTIEQLQSDQQRKAMYDFLSTSVESTATGSRQMFNRFISKMASSAWPAGSSEGQQQQDATAALNCFGRATHIMESSAQQEQQQQLKPPNEPPQVLVDLASHARNLENEAPVSQISQQETPPSPPPPPPPLPLPPPVVVQQQPPVEEQLPPSMPFQSVDDSFLPFVPEDVELMIREIFGKETTDQIDIFGAGDNLFNL